MKSPQAFRSIGEVAQLIGVATHVLRYWETQFPALAPVRRPDGRRYYRPEDVQLAAGLCVVMREEGLTIRGARRLIALDRAEGLRARGRERLAATAEPATSDASTEPRARKRATLKPVQKNARQAKDVPSRTGGAPPGAALPLFPDLDRPSPTGTTGTPSEFSLPDGAWLARLTVTAAALRRHAAPPPQGISRLRHELGDALHRARDYSA